MPLWGNNSTDTADVPAYLYSNGNYYNKDDCEGLTYADVDVSGANGVLTEGWTYIWNVSGTVTSITVDTAGSGYANGDVVTVSCANGSGASAVVVTNGTGNVTGVTVSAAGSGYWANATATAAGGTGATFTVNTTAHNRYEPLVAMSSMQ